MYSQLDQFSYLGMSNSRFFLVKEEQEEINSTSLTKPSSENADEINREGTAASSSTRLEPQGLRYEEEKDVDKKKDQKHDQYSPVVSPKEAASSSSSTRLELQELRKKEDDVDKEQEKYDQPCLGDQSEVADDDDDEGFKTPTSSDHKIPVISECPPAPKKSRPETSSTKRKLSPKIHRTLQLDLSEEVESMFPPPIQEDDTSPNSKKARTTKDDDEE